MPPSQGKGRSNYRLDTTGVIAAKGYGTEMYCHVRVVWDTTRDDDPGCAELPFDESPISHDGIMSVLKSLNDGTRPDRFA